jgi:uncharacterized protein (DUF433 family)
VHLYGGPLRRGARGGVAVAAVFEGAILGVDYRSISIIEPGKRGGKPCIRGLRITVYDVLEYLASGMTPEDILRDFPYLTPEEIQACLAYAADRERQAMASSS